MNRTDCECAKRFKRKLGVEATAKCSGMSPRILHTDRPGILFANPQLYKHFFSEKISLPFLVRK